MSLPGLLGVELPIVQAPMAGVQGSALAIAVCNAGALGSLPCAMLGPSAIRDELAAIRAATSHPFNVNFFCHTAPVADPTREAAWRDALAPYYRESGLDPQAAGSGAGREAFSAETAELLEALKPPIVSFHFGLPSADLLAHLRRWGAKVLASATTPAEARWLDARGVDAIIAQGVEAGGHRGMFLSTDVTTQIGSFALLPQVIRAVRRPVIAAGGIADAAGVAAALKLGASGVQVGTAYLLCPEATTSAVHRAALRGEGASHTALTNLFTGRPARGIVNRLMRELGPMSSTVPEFPLAVAPLAPLRAHAERSGRGDFSPLWSGQNASGCKAIAAAQLTHELAAGLG
ncbi:MAG: nitronate monooxygenase [Burkholderiaceae bacterium]